MGDFISRLLGLQDTSGLEAAMRQQTAEAKRTTDLALSVQTKAQEQAALALVSPADSESARVASENMLRRRRVGAAPDITDMGPAPIAYKMLTGA